MNAPTQANTAAPQALAEPVTVAGVMQFTKRPVTISAIQWTGQNLREVITFTQGPLDTSTMQASRAWEDYCDLVKRVGLSIHTLEGRMLVSVGDWIIRGVKGECYPCKPDIFAATYEAGAAPAVPAAAPPADFSQLPLAESEPNSHECQRWLAVINPLLKYAGSPGDWSYGSRLGLLTKHLYQVRIDLEQKLGRLA